MNEPTSTEKRMLIQNLSSVITDFDKENQVTMNHPNSWSSPKHKLFGYSTARQLRNAIKRKLPLTPSTK